MRTLTTLAVAGILALTVLPTVTVDTPVDTPVDLPADPSSEAPAAVEGCPFAGGAKVDPEREAPAPDVKSDAAKGSGCPFSAKSGNAEPIDPARERNQV